MPKISRNFLTCWSFFKVKLHSFNCSVIYHKNLPSLVLHLSLRTSLTRRNFLLNGYTNLNAVIASSQSDDHYQSNGNPRRPLIQWRWDLITTFLVLLGIEDQNQLKDSPLILNIKKGILAKQRKQYHQAEMLLHAALIMAQDLSYTDAETYIFDVMADNYFEKGDYSRALNLYLEVLFRISKREDFSYDDEAFIEISIKLAYCYNCLNQQDKAEKGFQFAIDTQLLRTEPFWNDHKSQLRIETIEDDQQRNSLALLGMAYDFYSKHLEQLSSKLLELALKYRLKALKISMIVNGEHPQTLVLENDVADLYVRINKYDQAKHYLYRAIEKAKDLQFKDLLPTFYLNLASIHCQENRQDLAKRYCQETYNLVSKSGIKNKQHTSENFEALTEKERLKLLEKSELCLNGLKFY